MAINGYEQGDSWMCANEHETILDKDLYGHWVLNTHNENGDLTQTQDDKIKESLEKLESGKCPFCDWD